MLRGVVTAPVQVPKFGLPTSVIKAPPCPQVVPCVKKWMLKRLKNSARIWNLSFSVILVFFSRTKFIEVNEDCLMLVIRLTATGLKLNTPPAEPFSNEALFRSGPLFGL